ncbi:uridine kinase family protein [Lentzea nigeriaca]|uniref:uridine kinase family protein n=1 Tax=Lentzea nigeriaca TaxID=1128665 RepID=UPI0027DE9466|nr:(d)CMP kinase [Lentzea nigeriaca]MBM7857810.1 uridine kinase [Lentzea nigeriaca]
MTNAPPRLGNTRLVAVDGPSGAGKSTFARKLAEELDATRMLTDHFATWDDPAIGWWPQVEAIFEEVAAGRTAYYRKTDWSQGFPRPNQGALVEVRPERTIIFEGMSSARKAIRSKLSLAIFVEHGDEKARLERAVARDGEKYREHFIRWQQYERGWFAVDETKARADYVVTSS